MSRLDELAADWDAISALLDEALALPEHERDAWLEGLRGECAARAPALRQILFAARIDAPATSQAGFETDDFLHALPTLAGAAGVLGAFARGADADADEPRAGDSVGPYRLIETLGQGGMGSVWLAERSDGQPKRRVALKLPRRAWEPGLTERLARERDILASLEHPNIARLYDAGVDSRGRPYLAMEHVEGQPIDRCVREQALPLRDVVSLLMEVCAAVAHAHARLVIHRDLKPGNILVTALAGTGPASARPSNASHEHRVADVPLAHASPRVRLLDFGIAKLLGVDDAPPTALTRELGVALTLDYASPEQIAGAPLGTASDIYSLGVVAYELLAGQRPYRLRRGTAAELEEAIAAVDPPRVSDMAATPERARELRGDLDAILNKALKKKPAERYASVDAFAQDLERWLAGKPVHARPDALGYRMGKFLRRYRLQATAVGLAVLALVAGAGVASWQALQARQQAERATTEAVTAKAVQGFIEQVFRASSGDQADPQRARETTARQLLDLGAERIRTELKDAPKARWQLLALLADIYQEMALLENAVDLHRQRVALSRTSFGERSPETAQALADMAQVMGYMGQRPEAFAAVDEAAAILDTRSDHASAQRFGVELAYAFLHSRSDFAKGVAAADRAVANARARADTAGLVRALQIQGELGTYTKAYDKARAAALEAIGLIEADAALGANSLSPTYTILAEAQSGLSNLDAADEAYRRALALARTHNAAAPVYVHTTAFAYAEFLRRHGRLRDSLDLSTSSHAWALASRGRYGPTPAMLALSHARALLAYGRVDDAWAALEEAQALLGAVPAAPEVEHAIVLLRARVLTTQGHEGRAREMLERADAFYASARLGPVAALSAGWREWRVANGAAARALSDFEAERRGGATSESDESPRSIAESAWLHLHAGHVERARALAERALAAIEARPSAYLAAVEAQATRVLGHALLQQGDAPAALAWLERSLAVHRRVFDPERSLDLADALALTASALHRAGRSDEASLALTEARRVHSRHREVGAHHRHLIEAWR